MAREAAATSRASPLGRCVKGEEGVNHCQGRGAAACLKDRLELRKRPAADLDGVAEVAGQRGVAVEVRPVVLVPVGGHAWRRRHTTVRRG